MIVSGLNILLFFNFPISSSDYIQEPVASSDLKDISTLHPNSFFTPNAFFVKTLNLIDYQVNKVIY